MLVLTLLVVLYVCTSSSSISRDRYGSRPPPYSNCGDDRLYDEVQEGLASIDSFPWLGLLIYPVDSFSPITTKVILISNDIALTTALEIDSYPKEDFRARSRVVLGNGCTGAPIRVRDYAFHPEYTRGTFSTLALLQLDTWGSGLQVFPICAPPKDFTNGNEIYVMVVANDCYNSSTVAMYKMEPVNSTHCGDFYKKMELDIKSIWPTHWVCARSPKSQPCVWRSGTALVIRHNEQWKLLGVGISGPGCQSLSRFLDYGMYHSWVDRSIAGIGEPTISRIAPNQLVLRRTTRNIQRYGRCDPEESAVEIYSEKTTVLPPSEDYGESAELVSAYFNVTLQDYVDYQCLVLVVWNTISSYDTPTIKIRRSCTGYSCTERYRGNVNYYVKINFRQMCTFQMTAYGAEYEEYEYK